MTKIPVLFAKNINLFNIQNATPLTCTIVNRKVMVYQIKIRIENFQIGISEFIVFKTFNVLKNTSKLQFNSFNIFLFIIRVESFFCGCARFTRNILRSGHVRMQIQASYQVLLNIIYNSTSKFDNHICQKKVQFSLFCASYFSSKKYVAPFFTCWAKFKLHAIHCPFLTSKHVLVDN